MVISQNIHKSTKHVGKYEEIIIQSLVTYFQLSGYEVVPHSSLNIAWGSILSDIDILLVKDYQLVCVEVKSHRDNLSKAPKQIDRIKDYVDYAYIATDKPITNLDVIDAGLILVQQEKIKIIKKARKFTNKPRLDSVATLKKKCIASFFGDYNRYFMLTNKYELAVRVYLEGKCTRDCLKEIVTCGEQCDIDCPIIERESKLLLEVSNA